MTSPGGPAASYLARIVARGTGAPGAVRPRLYAPALISPRVDGFVVEETGVSTVDEDLGTRRRSLAAPRPMPEDDEPEAATARPHRLPPAPRPQPSRDPVALQPLAADAVPVPELREGAAVPRPSRRRADRSRAPAAAASLEQGEHVRARAGQRPAPPPTTIEPPVLAALVARRPQMQRARAPIPLDWPPTTAAASPGGSRGRTARPPTAPTVQVSIGRVDVRAVLPARAPTATRPPAPGGVMSLDDYVALRRRSRR